MRTFCTTHAMGKIVVLVMALTLGMMLSSAHAWADDDQPKGNKGKTTKQQKEGEAAQDGDGATKQRPEGRPGAAARNRLRQGGGLGTGASEQSEKPGQGGAGDRPMRDMSQVVAMMIRQFDQDGDEKLDTTELTEMLTAIRQRPGMAGFFQGGNRPQQRPGAGKGQRPGQDNVSDEAGGVTPKRPPVSDDPATGGDDPGK